MYRVYYANGFVSPQTFATYQEARKHLFACNPDPQSCIQRYESGTADCEGEWVKVPGSKGRPHLDKDTVR